MIILVFLFLFSGMFLAVISVPMILGKIPPNGFYGFRVRKTMEDPEIWYTANAYSGKWLLVASLVMALATVGLYFVPGISLDIYAYTVLSVWIFAFAVMVIVSVRYLNISLIRAVSKIIRATYLGRPDFISFETKH